MPETYHLVYFNIRGLAEQTRLLMYDNNVQFTEDRVSYEEWAKIKPQMQFGQVPCLKTNGQQYVQSGAIMRHLGRAHGLYGQGNAEATYIDMVYEGVKDLQQKYIKIIYQEYDKKDEFVSKVLPEELQKFEKLLSSKTGGYINGEKISFADYFLYEQIDCVETMAPGCLDKYPTLKAYQERFRNRPNLKAYLQSDQRRGAQINGNGKQ